MDVVTLVERQELLAAITRDLGLRDAVVVKVRKTSSSPATYLLDLTVDGELVPVRLGRGRRWMLRRAETMVTVSEAVGRFVARPDDEAWVSLVDLILQAAEVAAVGDKVTGAGLVRHYLREFLVEEGMVTPRDLLNGMIKARTSKERDTPIPAGSSFRHNGRAYLFDVALLAWLRVQPGVPEWLAFSEVGEWLLAAGCTWGRLDVEANMVDPDALDPDALVEKRRFQRRVWYVPDSVLSEPDWCTTDPVLEEGPSPRPSLLAGARVRNKTDIPPSSAREGDVAS